MHTARITLTCDIEYKNHIIFENKEVYFYGEVELYNVGWQGHHIDYFEIEEWHSDDLIARADRAGYLYTLNMNEWASDLEVEDFDNDIPYSEFTLLVKSEDYDDVEIDYGQFEPDWDIMREGK